MRVLRGRAATPAADRERTAEMLARAGETGVPALRVWTPHRQVAFGPRDANADGSTRAAEAARERGFPPVERSVGGRAVAYTGSTLAVAHAVPLDDPRSGLTARYEAATDRLRTALRSLRVDAVPGEPPDSFCPGDHSLALRDGGKVAGLAQRVRTDAALVAGCVVVADRAEFVDVVSAVYDALDVPFDPGSVGSVADGGGPADPASVRWAVERAFVEESGAESVVRVRV